MSGSDASNDAQTPKFDLDALERLTEEFDCLVIDFEKEQIRREEMGLAIIPKSISWNLTTEAPIHIWNLFGQNVGRAHLKEESPGNNIMIYKIQTKSGQSIVATLGFGS